MPLCAGRAGEHQGTLIRPRAPRCQRRRPARTYTEGLSFGLCCSFVQLRQLHRITHSAGDSVLRSLLRGPVRGFRNTLERQTRTTKLRRPFARRSLSLRMLTAFPRHALIYLKCFTYSQNLATHTRPAISEADFFFFSVCSLTPPPAMTEAASSIFSRKLLSFGLVGKSSNDLRSVQRQRSETRKDVLHRVSFRSNGFKSLHMRMKAQRKV